MLLIRLNGNTLPAWKLMQRIGIIRDCTEQFLDQCITILWNILQWIACLLHRFQDIKCRCGCIQPYTVADTPVLGWIIRQNQGNAFCIIRLVCQYTITFCQLCDKVGALLMQSVAHNRNLATFTIIRLALKTDCTGDKSPIHFWQHHLHGDIATA